MQNWNGAVGDCNFVIERAETIDVSNVKKAYYRRGQAQRGLGGSRVNLEGALADFKKLLALEPASKDAPAEIRRTEMLLDECSDASSASAPVSSAIMDGSELRPLRTTLKARPVAQPDAVVAEPHVVGVTTPIGKPERVRTPKTVSPNPGSPSKFVIPGEPKSVYDFEKTGRSLLRRPEALSEYLCSFKKSTSKLTNENFIHTNTLLFFPQTASKHFFSSSSNVDSLVKKLFKQAISAELMSATLSVLRDFVPVAQVFVFLDSLSQVTNFSMTLALLPATDELCIRSIFERLTAEETPETHSKVQELKTLFKL